MKRLFPVVWLLVLLAPGCSVERDTTALDNPFDPRNAEDFPVPDSVSVVLGNNLVQLDWTIEDQASFDEYAIFRRRVDTTPVEDEKLLARVDTPGYRDAQVRSGRTYEYRIAAGRNGRFGERSEPVEAQPGLFAILVSDDAAKTRNRTVAVSLNVPGPVQAVQISEDAGFTGAPWRTAAPTVSWILSAGDGEHTVYGRFRLADGSESIPVLDTIVLDTRAVISLVEFTGPDTRMAGDTVHFRLDAGEPGGIASVTVTGLFTAATLLDDGTRGDPAAGDGVYERDLVIPAGKTVTAAAVTGSFLDDIGNSAGTVDAARTLTVARMPDPVTAGEPETALPPAPAGVTVRWTQSTDTAFASYRVFRSAGPSVETADHLVGSAASRTTLELADAEVAEGDTYAYRVFVVNGSGLMTGSNVVTVEVPNLRPPQAPVLEDIETASDSVLALAWDRNEDRDFLAYRIYRNTTGAVSDADPLVTEISDPMQTYFDDSGLAGGTEYFYRVYAVDRGGLQSRSNEVSFTTSSNATSGGS